MSESECVLVFRKRLLAWSETFIADQGKYLQHMRAVFAGFRRDASGYALLDNQDCCLQEDYALLAALARMRLRMGYGINRRWRAALEQRQPVLLHAHFGPDALAALPLAQELDIPLIATFHGFDITKRDSRPAYLKQRARVFEEADAVIAVSDYIKSCLIEAGCPEAKIRQHYIGINLEHYQGTKQEAEQPTILFIGRLVHKKGCTYLLDAMRQVQDAVPDARLLIAGDGPLRETLEKQALALRDVEFLGVQDTGQIRDLLRQAWVMCTPSIIADSGDAEGLGMVFLEAQALATPAVSFNTGGVVEAIADGETGLCIREKDTDALAEGLISLLRDDSLRRRYGDAGKQRVHEQFDIRRQCTQLEEIYRSVIGT